MCTINNVKSNASIVINEEDYSLLNLGIPTGFSQSIENPYGVDKDEKFLLSEENELFLYKSWDTDSGKKVGNQNAYYMDGYKNSSNDPYNDFKTRASNGVLQHGILELLIIHQIVKVEFLLLDIN